MPRRGGPLKHPSYAYAKQVEYEARNRLLQEGASLVVRSAGSRSPADLIAIFPKKGEIWLVQVKAQDVEEMGDLRTKFWALKSLEGMYELKAALFAKQKGRYQFLLL